MVIFLTIDQPGNKCDVDETGSISYFDHLAQRRSEQVRMVTPEEGAALAREMTHEIGSPVAFLEASAKLNHNVTTAFAGQQHVHGHTFPASLRR